MSGGALVRGAWASVIHRPGRFALVQILLAALWLGVCPGVGAPALAEDAAPPPAAPPPANAGQLKTLVVWEHEAPAALLADPKDANLLKALSFVPARLDELRAKSADFRKVPESVQRAVLTLLSHPLRLAITDRGADPKTGAPGYGAVISIGMSDEAGASAMQKNITEIMALSGGAPPTRASTAFPGMTELDAPVGVISFGPHKTGAGKWRWEVFFGPAGSAEEAFTSLPAAKGMTAWGRGRIDFAACTPLVEMIGAMGGPQLEPYIAGARARGFVGADAVTVECTVGQEEGWLTATSVARGMWRFHETAGLTRDGVTAQELAAIPADVTAASVFKIDASAMWKSIESFVAKAPEPAQLFARFREATHVDPGPDFFDALGSTAAIYMSDATGGGGLLSGVGAVLIRDRARLLATRDKLCDAFNAAMAEQKDESADFRMAKWKDAGVDYTGLRFNGMPVPLELTVAMTDKWMLFGITPEGAKAAARQAAGAGDGGMGTNAAYKQALGDSKSVPLSIAFVDTPRLLRDTYGVLTLAGSAIANAVRSARDDAREPGMIVPTFAEMSKGARPLLAISMWEGDDFVSRCRTDRSILVSLTGGVGTLSGGGGAAAAIGGGILLPALGRARQNAQMLKDGVQLRQIAMSAAAYAANHEGNWPPSLQALVDGGMLDPDVLKSPIDAVDDGGGDYFWKTGKAGEFDPSEIAGYSRASFANGKGVNVAYADGRVLQMPEEEFRKVLAQPKQKATGWRLPGAKERAQPRP